MSPVGRGPRARRDRGLAESLQWSLLAPVVVLSVLGAVEGGIVLEARSCVQQAALAGAEAAAVTAAGHTAAVQAATNVATVGGLSAVTVSTVPHSGTVSVTVTARVALPIDLGFGVVQSTATMTTER